MSAILNMRNISLVNTFIGPGSSRMAGTLCEQMNLRMAFVVCDAGVKEAGLVAGLVESLNEKGVSAYLFDRVAADAPDTVIDEAAQLCREYGCQVVIAAGGGSTLDTGKCIAMLQNNPGKISDYALAPTKARRNGAPLILIPTTAGTGSEVTMGAVVAIQSMGVKAGFAGRDLLADFALIDPLLTLGLPPRQTAFTGMDAFSHCVESMLTSIANPVCDIFSLEGIRLITRNIATVVENGNHVEARQNMMLAAYLAGMSLSDSGCSFGHAFAHAVGAKYHLPHGELCAIALPMVLEFFAESFSEKIHRIAGAMGLELPASAGNADVAAAAANAVRALNARLGIPKISELGFGYDALPALAERMMKDASVIRLMSGPGRRVALQDLLGPMQREYTLM